MSLASALASFGVMLACQATVPPPPPSSVSDLCPLPPAAHDWYPMPVDDDDEWDWNEGDT